MGLSPSHGSAPLVASMPGITSRSKSWSPGARSDSPQPSWRSHSILSLETVVAVTLVQFLKPSPGLHPARGATLPIQVLVFAGRVVGPTILPHMRLFPVTEGGLEPLTPYRAVVPWQDVILRFKELEAAPRSYAPRLPGRWWPDTLTGKSPDIQPVRIQQQF